MPPMLSVPAIIAITVSLVAVFSLARGSAPEKVVAVLLIADQLVDWIYLSLRGASQSFVSVDPLLVMWDLLYALALIFVCLRANRVWVFFFGSAQIVVVLGHVSAWTWHDGMQQAYWAMTQMPLFLQLVALAWGGCSHVARFRRIGPYRSWRVAGAGGLG